MERHILVVFPHPDDECFGTSGSLAKYISEGTAVTYACLTLGERARNMGNPIMANRVSLPQIRKLELHESCQHIGITDIRMMGYLDKTIEFEDHEKLDKRINDLITELNPSLVITFHPKYSVHPDHDATGAAVIRTIAKMPKEQRPTVHCLAFTKGCEEILGKPDVITDVSAFLKQKLGSIQSHRSQWQLPADPQMVESEEMKERFGTERFWTYSFE
ncbi:bacillithiol biosynthesis deacetylase BshB2 [Paenibacillus crassostreae]|uniref:Bacillithiol biosynthesis deacetylase BshB2 n=1 Tax=Paenibacillus crassostreae TaxID=1763538 RepID=A0A167FI67_9BACL|nr:bacillithiol biosynthesis deacetylase BshB2 [Paenibacillus crassostreae]AOZ94382.1 bacillithiol biosynthesis deacetylase BshB2 [Paenibacillus crassostreae]OAB76582.1 bacillithiol biosynthesis deacetylase BshB2 [Paenibacillus crassostreae]